MPIYEYEPIDWDCLICGGRFEVIQNIGDDPLKTCPTCGLDCRKLISKAQIKVSKYLGSEHAGRKGFTTYKKSGEGVWERTGGEGVDVILGADEDRAAVKEESRPVNKLDLDKE